MREVLYGEEKRLMALEVCVGGNDKDTMLSCEFMGSGQKKKDWQPEPLTHKTQVAAFQSDV